MIVWLRFGAKKIAVLSHSGNREGARRNGRNLEVVGWHYNPLTSPPQVLFEARRGGALEQERGPDVRYREASGERTPPRWPSR